MLEDFSYEKQSTSERHDIFDLVVNLEVLQSCNYSCAGCHVDTDNKNPMVDTVLNNALAIGEHYVDKGVRFREIVLSATDLFTAKNTDEVLKNPTLHKLARLRGDGDTPTNGNTVGDQNLGITSAAIFDGLDFKRIREVFSILDNPDYFRPNMTVELLIPMDTQKIIDRDRSYIQKHKDVFKFFENETPKHVIYSLVNNIFLKPELKKEGMYQRCRDVLQEEFGIIMEHNPSFFRSNRNDVIRSGINAWRKVLESQLDKGNWKETHLSSASQYFNSLNTLALHFIKDEAYIAPFVYENSFLRREKFLIREANNPERFSEKYAELMGEALEYADSVDDCRDCEMQIACVGRNVQNVMKEIGEVECIFPRGFREKFHPNPRG